VSSKKRRRWLALVPFFLTISIIVLVLVIVRLSPDPKILTFGSPSIATIKGYVTLSDTESFPKTLKIHLDSLEIQSNQLPALPPEIDQSCVYQIAVISTSPTIVFSPQRGSIDIEDYGPDRNPICIDRSSPSYQAQDVGMDILLDIDSRNAGYFKYPFDRLELQVAIVVSLAPTQFDPEDCRVCWSVNPSLQFHETNDFWVASASDNPTVSPGLPVSISAGSEPKPFVLLFVRPWTTRALSLTLALLLFAFLLSIPFAKTFDAAVSRSIALALGAWGARLTINLGVAPEITYADIFIAAYFGILLLTLITTAYLFSPAAKERSRRSKKVHGKARQETRLIIRGRAVLDSFRGWFRELCTRFKKRHR
jgi:hypothetical protein